MFATRNGLTQKTVLTEYARVMSKGKKAIVIREGDELIGVALTDGRSEILLANRNGRAIRFDETKVRAQGRVSSGVRGMKLDGGDDAVVGLVTISPEEPKDVLTLSANGYGKRSLLEDYRTTARGCKGVKTMNITDRTGRLVAFEGVTDENDLVIINESGVTIRIHVADLRVMGRATQGVRIINLEKRNDKIASVCCVDTDPEEEVEAVEEGEALPEMDLNQIDEAETEAVEEAEDESEEFDETADNE